MSNVTAFTIIEPEDDTVEFIITMSGIGVVRFTDPKDSKTFTDVGIVSGAAVNPITPLSIAKAVTSHLKSVYGTFLTDDYNVLPDCGASVYYDTVIAILKLTSLKRS